MPSSRIAAGNVAPVRGGGEYVLYWMIASRRTEWNFALDRATEWARDLKKPLLIFEPLRAGYRWASDRIHRFVIDGMADNAARIGELSNPGVGYFPYMEPSPDAGRGLLEALAARACVVVTDEFPAFFLPRMVAGVAPRLPVRLEQVDSNGLLPLRAAERVFTTAYSFRRFLQRALPAYLERFPLADPVAAVALPPLKGLPPEMLRRWPRAPAKLLGGGPRELAALPIDHSVPVVAERGGARAARVRLKRFLDDHLARYGNLANEPDAGARSGLSPYLHFGQISSYELFHELTAREGWTPGAIASKVSGKREGWWGMSPGAEAWLDQFITWRELGYNMSWRSDDYDRYESLPDWSRATLEKHGRDRRDYIYALDQFAAAATHDPLWNAAQSELISEGRIQNYLRMLWGKKIVEWTATPRGALAVMIELNNKYALDGRDPNSYSGIFWCLGRYDRPWGPERSIFGTVRYMSSENTRRKLHLAEYIRKFSAPQRRGEQRAAPGNTEGPTM